jgi:hypothetical protein
MTTPSAGGWGSGILTMWLYTLAAARYGWEPMPTEVAAIAGYQLAAIADRLANALTSASDTLADWLRKKLGA